MDPRASRDAVEKREILCTYKESNHGLSVGRLGHSLKEIAVSPVFVHLRFSTIAGVQGKQNVRRMQCRIFFAGRPNDPYNLHKFHLSVHLSRTLYRQVGLIPT
jgi:hypothetical protein